MSILSRLGGYPEGRIVDFTLSDDKWMVKIEECCDNYFSETLTKAEFAQMIAELQTLHDRMVG